MCAQHHDTIVALSTPPGRSGVAVVRLSGPDAIQIARKRLAKSDSNKHAALRQGQAGLHWLINHVGQTLDRALVLPFYSPRSYTGEDLVEFQVHGSPWVVDCLIKDLCLEARMAQPGEFTRRAVESGRLSLSQAEAVLSLIESRSAAAHGLAVRGLAGEPGRRMQDMLERLLDQISLVEAELDFSEHEITSTPQHVLVEASRLARGTLQAWRDTWRIGRLAGGALVVLCGAPNAGKSTLMNALLCETRVLVDEDPGTTRDAVSQRMVLGSIAIELWDTAGLHDVDDRVERKGMARTRDLLTRADLILHVVAPGQGPIPELLNDDRALLVYTKCDLLESAATGLGTGLQVSGLTGKGLDVLQAAMSARLESVDWQQLNLVVTEYRHVQLLDQAIAALARWEQALVDGIVSSMAVIDLREAAQCMGEIVGAVNMDCIYPRIFARFCIGK